MRNIYVHATETAMYFMKKLNHHSRMNISKAS